MTSHAVIAIALACMVFAGLIYYEAVEAGAPGSTQPDRGHDKCATECSNCQRACEACAHHCAHLLEQGKKEHHHTLRTCQDCAAICGVAASIVARKGPFSDSICQACIEVCSRCAKECEKYSQDKEMKQCAEECRRCEQACRDMVATITGKKTEGRK